MFFNNANGQTITAVDVCKTPTPAGPVPVPYPNIANNAQAVGHCRSIFIMGTPAHNTNTQSLPTNGDQAGVLGGILSNTIMGPCQYTTGSTIVQYNGAPATRFTDMRALNNRNAFGAQVSPSQTKYICLR